jgi:preprotein translocase subunit SecD
LYQQPAGDNPAQQPASWLVRITLPAAAAAALTAITTQAVNPQAQIAIIVAGQTWGVPSAQQPLTNGQFVIAAQSKDQALQLQRVLLPA